MTEGLKRQVEYVWCTILIEGSNRSDEYYSSNRDISSLQSRNYKIILDRVSNIKTGVISTNLQLWGILSSHADIVFPTGRGGPVKRLNVDGLPLPVIDNNDIEKFEKIYAEYMKANPPIGEAKDLAYFILGSILELLRPIVPDNIGFSLGSHQKNVELQIVRYLSVREVIEYINLERGEAGERYEAFSKYLQSNMSEAINNFAKLDENYTTIHSLVEQLGKTSSELTTKVNNQVEDLDKSLVDFTQRFESQKGVLEKRLELNALGRLWEGVARRSKWATIITSLVIASLVGFGVFAAYQWGGDIVDFIVKHRANVDGTSANAFGGNDWVGLQVSRIFVVSVPTVLYIWLVKLLVRFLFRSLALYDDAVQRKTIMDSYFMLADRDAVDDKILPLIIWALCRQVPGHGPDGIEPPDFSEVINAGLNFGKKGQGA